MLSLTENTHRDKSLAGFSICCYRNSICLRLDMFATQTRDLYHIELERSDNISSSSKARTYRAGEVDISTEKTRARVQGKILIFLLFFRLCRGWGSAPFTLFGEFFILFFRKDLKSLGGSAKSHCKKEYPDMCKQIYYEKSLKAFC